MGAFIQTLLKSKKRLGWYILLVLFCPALCKPSSIFQLRLSESQDLLTKEFRYYYASAYSKTFKLLEFRRTPESYLFLFLVTRALFGQIKEGPISVGVFHDQVDPVTLWARDQTQCDGNVSHHLHPGILPKGMRTIPCQYMAKGISLGPRASFLLLILA